MAQTIENKRGRLSLAEREKIVLLSKTIKDINKLAARVHRTPVTVTRVLNQAARKKKARA